MKRISSSNGGHYSSRVYINHVLQALGLTRTSHGWTTATCLDSAGGGPSGCPGQPDRCLRQRDECEARRMRGSEPSSLPKMKRTSSLVMTGHHILPLVHTQQKIGPWSRKRIFCWCEQRWTMDVDSRIRRHLLGRTEDRMFHFLKCKVQKVQCNCSGRSCPSQLPSHGSNFLVWYFDCAACGQRLLIFLRLGVAIDELCLRPGQCSEETAENQAKPGPPKSPGPGLIQLARTHPTSHKFALTSSQSLDSGDPSSVPVSRTIWSTPSGLQINSSRRSRPQLSKRDSVDHNSRESL